MTRRRAWTWAAGAGVLLVASACGELGAPAVVQLGDESFTLGDLRRANADLAPADRPILSTREHRLAFVERVVDRHLMIRYGRELAAEDPAVGARIREIHRDIMIRRLRTLEGGEIHPREEDVLAAHARMAERRTVEHAFFATEAAAASVADDPDAPARFAAIVDRAGGVLDPRPGHFVWTPFPDAVSDAVADLDVGDVSRPIRDGAQWVVVRVTRLDAITPPPLEDTRIRILRGLRARGQQERVAALSQRMRQKAAVRIEDAGVDLLVQRTAEAILAFDRQDLDAEWAIPSLADDEREQAVATRQGASPWTAGNYVEAMVRVPAPQRPRSGLRTSIEAATWIGMDVELFHEEARRRNLERDWWVARAMRRAEEDRYVQAALDRLTEATTVPDEEVESLTATILETQPSLFRTPDTYWVLWLEYPSREEVVRDLRHVREIGGLAERVAELLESRVPTRVTYRVMSLRSDQADLAPIARQVVEGGVGALAGPADLGGIWVLAECLRIQPGRQLTPDEIRQDVRERLRRSDRRGVEAWLAGRREELGMRVDEAALDAIAPGA